MATISLGGLDNLLSDLLGASELPVDEMLEAGSSVAIEAQKKAGERMRVYRTGVTLGSLKKEPIFHGARSTYQQIVFAGTNKDGNRNAEVAFINEYGKTGQPARPFISIANEESASDIAVAEYKAFDEHLKKHNL